MSENILNHSPSIVHTDKSLPQRIHENLDFLCYAILVLGFSSFFTNHYIAGLQSTRIEAFSDLFIPLATLFIHLLLLRFLPLVAYFVLATIDFLLSLGIATYHNYFGENLDIHVVLASFHEGTEVSGYILDLIPKGLLVMGILVLIIQFYLASRIKEKIRGLHLFLLAMIVVPMFGYAVYKIPLQNAKKVTDYAMCIKVHGYYTAVLSDYLYSGRIPSDAEMLGDIQELEKANPLEKIPFQITVPHPYDTLLAIQVESLDYNVLGFRSRGREVTPFLNRLRNESILLKLNSFHYGASGSSGADFQFLCGELPLSNFPTFKIRSIDYSHSLPALFAQKNIRTYAFHGNAASMWGRGQAYKKMEIAKFFDPADYSKLDTRWGISDSLFLQESRQKIEQLGPGSVYFLITLSSHGPFNYIDNPVFPASDLTGKYLNSINYVDRCLEDFFHRLPGNILVIVYGDHSAGVGNQEYSSKEGKEEYVPAMIFIRQDDRNVIPVIQGDASNLLTGRMDIRSLHYFALTAFP
jgi:lipoteichoic acid synthase